LQVWSREATVDAVFLPGMAGSKLKIEFGQSPTLQ